MCYTIVQCVAYLVTAIVLLNSPSITQKGVSLFLAVLSYDHQCVELHRTIYHTKHRIPRSKIKIVKIWLTIDQGISRWFADVQNSQSQLEVKGINQK